MFHSTLPCSVAVPPVDWQSAQILIPTGFFMARCGLGKQSCSSFIQLYLLSLPNVPTNVIMFYICHYKIKVKKYLLTIILHKPSLQDKPYLPSHFLLCVCVCVWAFGISLNIPNILVGQWINSIKFATPCCIIRCSTDSKILIIKHWLISFCVRMNMAGHITHPLNWGGTQTNPDDGMTLTFTVRATSPVLTEVPEKTLHSMFPIT